MKIRLIWALGLAVLTTLLTTIVAPVYVPNQQPFTTYSGFPLPWLSSTNVGGWIPIIGPFISIMTTEFNFFYLAIDYAVFLVICILILAGAQRVTDDS